MSPFDPKRSLGLVLIEFCSINRRQLFGAHCHAAISVSKALATLASRVLTSSPMNGRSATEVNALSHVRRYATKSPFCD
jgi:predicted protein tyrosine phosphatase